MSQIAGNQVNAERHPVDDYPTEPAWTQVLLDRVALPGPVWECAAGAGAMAETMRQAGLEVVTSDLVRDGFDFLADPPPHLPFRSIVTNPPYRDLTEFILRGLEYRPGVLALLVGLHFLGGAARSQVYRQHPPSLVLVVPERMVVNGKPSQFNHAWLVWYGSGSGFTRLEWRSAR